jgi:hypothetical protein
MLLQASEMLLSAKTIKNPEEREAKLREALQVCKLFEFWYVFRVVWGVLNLDFRLRTAAGHPCGECFQ